MPSFVQRFATRTVVLGLAGGMCVLAATGVSAATLLDDASVSGEVSFSVAPGSLPEVGVPPVPAVPSLPGVGLPGVPALPGVDDLPGLPAVPGLPALPGVPSVPGLPTLPGAGLPALPGVPTVPSLPAAPDLGGVIAGVGGLVQPSVEVTLDLVAQVAAGVDLN